MLLHIHLCITVLTKMLILLLQHGPKCCYIFFNYCEDQNDFFSFEQLQDRSKYCCIYFCYSVDQIITSLLDIFHQVVEKVDWSEYVCQILTTCTSLLIQLDQLVPVFFFPFIH